MATTPEPVPVDFRAPPPSPIASGRRSSVTNDEILTEFLHTSLHVPDLVLPDKIFPRQKYHETPPLIDFQSILMQTMSADDQHDDTAECNTISHTVLDSIARTGCFQLVNHGIPSEVIRWAAVSAAGIFDVPPEKRAAVARSPDKPYGFEEHYDHQEEEAIDDELMSQEFVWSRDKGLELEMEAIWPLGYSNFREKMETLLSFIEKVGERILEILILKSFAAGKSAKGFSSIQRHENGTVCCLYKHSCRANYSLKHDVIRMLIRGSDYPHALCLHICDGCSDFHVYSKKGWLSFNPEVGALIVTCGDQIQVMSGGHYKQVMGRPMFMGDKETCISMAFLYLPSTSGPKNNHEIQSKREKTVSVGRQVIVAIILTLLYHFFLYIYKN